MFQFSYAASELRRRLGRTLLTALGLAAGVSLVMGIIGVSQGLSEAQDDVLAPLQAVGTDILVTRVAGSSTGDTTAAASSPPQGATPQQAPNGFFGGPGGAGGQRSNQLNAQDQTDLLKENSSVVTDLSKLGKPGDKFTHDFFLSATLLSFPQASIDDIAKIDGVASVAGGLTQLASHQTGTVPQITAEIQTGGQEITQEIRQDPLTQVERDKMEACLRASGGAPESGDSSQGAQGTPPRIGGAGGSAFQKCLPERLQRFTARFTTPLQTIRQAIDPPATDIATTTYTAAGVDPAHPDQGLVTRAQLTEGEWLKADAPNEVLISTAYANKNKLQIGAVLPINGTDYKVVGLVSPTLSGNTADVYFTLGKLQELATKQDRVTQVLVKAKDASSVDTVVKKIQELLPGAQVVTTKDLTDQVTGSLKDAKNLTDRLGGAFAVIVLVGAFVIAMLLTLSSVAKRVREIGTLRAIGWGKRRVVNQILAETLGIGVLGGVLGVGLGGLVCLAIEQFAPTFTATVTSLAGINGSRYSQFFGQSNDALTQTTQVALHVPLHPATIALALLFALLGGVLAGVVGGWRAARLSPATALRNVG